MKTLLARHLIKNSTFRTRFINRSTIISLVAICLLLITFSVAHSTIYYVDYQGGSDSNTGKATSTPWKRCPGMPGFAGSYSHSNGDVFVFKGGVTWTAPVDRVLTVGYSGGSSTPDQYVGGQRCGQSGSPSCNGGVAWGSGYPVFDGNSAGGYIVYATAKNSLVFDGIKFYNAAEYSNGAGCGLDAERLSNIEVKNCWIETLTINGFYYGTAAGQSYSKIYFHDNHIKKVGRIPIQPVVDSYIDDVQIYNNLYEGPGTYDGGSYHLDGFMIGGANTSAYAITNLKIYNNKFYGDWFGNITAQIYINGSGSSPSTQHTQIYNNILAYENNAWGGYSDTISPGMIAILGRHDDIKIYNNTISADATPSNDPVGSCISLGLSDISNLVIENNILSGCYRAIDITSAVTSRPIIDYNIYKTSTLAGNHMIYSDMTAYNGVCDTPAACNTLGSWEAHGIKADPKFVALPSGGVTGSGDWSLQSDSPAIAVGANLRSIFLTDIAYRVRPSNGPWTLGAWQYSLTPPVLRIIAK
jgi:hypothetical protein